ncbi:MAG: hypothetical protein JXB14_00795 [Candidatus Altiarchaeota archaeon]|nr:hypothetical protein [Candidatus Altiarchaeota archaeon]
MKTAVFLSVREKATRLPKKILMEIGGRTVIEHLIDRLKTAERPDMIVLCTSVHPDDAILAEIAEKNGIEAFRGSEDDKLDRYLQAAKRFGVDFMVIVDGDDIFCDAGYIDRTIERFEKTGADFIATKGLPLGAASTGLKLNALEKACEIKAQNDTEVWGGYFTGTGLFKVEYIEADPEVRRPDIRMTLDYQEDFDFFKRVFDELYAPGRIFSLGEIISLIEKKPEIAGINKGVQKLYEENLKRHTKIALKEKYKDKGGKK